MSASLRINNNHSPTYQNNCCFVVVVVIVVFHILVCPWYDCSWRSQPSHQYLNLDVYLVLLSLSELSAMWEFLIFMQVKNYLVNLPFVARCSILWQHNCCISWLTITQYHVSRYIINIHILLIFALAFSFSLSWNKHNQANRLY